MGKRLVLLILVFFMGVVPEASGFGAETARQTLLRDGCVLRGVNGKLTRQDEPALIRREPKLDWCESGWFFELDMDLSDYRGRVSAGTKLELLPSSTLEKMIADANERSTTGYRLSGWVTKYKGRNFIYPNYFSKPQSQPQPQESKPTERPSTKESKQQLDVTEPNDALAIPQEIIEKLKSSRVMRSERLGRIADAKEGAGVSVSAEKAELKRDSILADRTAFLTRQDGGRLTFILDALGRNVRPVSLRLLPCEVLELAEYRQSAEPEPVRFKMAGIMTKYKGENYLLLQKAIRVYSHQNFDR